ncbi:MAG: ankyrin repeat domain-containing protein [Puniceicoccales bacterium]|jgi:hypothetical protein|nr:ankyrin repeat domain-containing protein [Puniceicoccales bacterium]
MRILKCGIVGLGLLVTGGMLAATPEEIAGAIITGYEHKIPELINAKNVNTLLGVLFEGSNAQMTPFYLACATGQVFIGEYLAQLNPYVRFTCTERWGRQAIHEAAAKNARELVLLLLAMGANPESQSAIRETPLSIAKRHNRQNTICILQKAIKYKPETYESPDNCIELIINCIRAGELGLPIEIINELLRTESPLRFSFLKCIYLLAMDGSENVQQVKRSLLATAPQKRRVFAVMSQEFFKFRSNENCMAALWWLKAYLQQNWENFMGRVKKDELNPAQTELYDDIQAMKDEFVSVEDR